MIKLSIITVAYNNLEGIKETYESLSQINGRDYDYIEWVVIDGGSSDGTSEYLSKLGSVYNLKYISESDKGIYDAMNKGIAISTGKYALFLNSGDSIVAGAADLIHEICISKIDNTVFLCDAILNFGNSFTKIRKAKKIIYIYHSLPASHQAIIYPLSVLKEVRYDLSYKVSSDYALTAKLYKKGFKFIRFSEILSSFSIGGVSTVNSEQLCLDAMKVQKEILKMPKPFICLSYFFRRLMTNRVKKNWEKVDGTAIK